MKDLNNFFLMENIIIYSSSMASIASIPLTLYIAKIELNKRKEKTKKEIIQALTNRLSKSTKLEYEELISTITSIIDNNNISNTLIRISEIIRNLVFEISNNPFIGERKRTLILTNLRDLRELLEKKANSELIITKQFGSINYEEDWDFRRQYDMGGKMKDKKYYNRYKSSPKNTIIDYSYLFKSEKRNILPNNIVSYIYSWIIAVIFYFFSGTENYIQVIGTLLISLIFLILFSMIEKFFNKSKANYYGMVH